VSDPAPKDEFANALSACLPLFWTAVAFGGGVNLLFLASPLFMLQIYNRVIPSGSIVTLVALSFALIVALVTMALLDAIRSRVLVRAAARLDRLLSPRVFQAMTDLSVWTGAGGRNAQPLRDLDAFRSAMAGPAQLFFDAPWSPIFIVVLFILHPLLGAIGLVGGLTLLGLAVLNEALTREDAEAAGAAANRSYAFADSVVRFSDPVRAMGMSDALQVRWRVDRDRMMIKQGAGADRGADMAAVIRFSRMVLQSAILGVGAWLVVEGRMLPASIFAGSLLLGRALSPIEQAVVGWRQMASAVAAGRNVQRVLNAAPPPPQRLHVPVRDGGVVLDRVSFTPLGAARPALIDIDLVIEAGETVGVVGASGAGKSCLARLLVAASMPSKGKVAIAAVSTRKWPADALARHVGYLPQGVGLFPGSLRDNIGRFAQADDRAIVQAAKRARAHEMIMALPDGYETVIGDGGVGLSGGQRQRIALARALYGAPRLIVLDEPNAHLDAEGEEALSESLEALKQDGATIIIVAHRLNPLAQVDRVLMLKQGRLALDGPRQAIIGQVPTEVVEHFARSEARA
jgi:ATP-binding cassette subfamily C exporter for protease/lipase